MRSYNEYCAIAQALDVVGERWSLLIVRELLIRGPSRYTDLRFGLPGIATNLLADRLRELEEAGVVEREEAPPPVATTLFKLTERGRQLEPVLLALGRWGGPMVQRPIGDNEFRSHWLAIPLEAHLKDRTPAAPPQTIEIRTADQPMLLEVGAGKVDVRPGKADHADLRLTGSASQVLGLLLNRLEMGEARGRGLKIEGNTKVLKRVQP
ncbi:MAG TPA: winged helix-turn-helix transcriptional regulator [Candidatus Dormibacteraeota bacterium]|nr:winged helix-turn-helix transcriptional regulator [Candidatus Dormibacteraeota bacterium]